MKRNPIPGIIIFLVLVGFVIFCFPPNLGRRWTEIENPEAFYKECISLYEQNKIKLEEDPHYIVLEKEQYSEEIKKINPRAVTVNYKSINVLISSGGIGKGWGYVVYPVDYDIKKEKNIESSKYKNIYKYVTSG